MLRGRAGGLRHRRQPLHRGGRRAARRGGLRAACRRERLSRCARSRRAARACGWRIQSGRALSRACRATPIALSRARSTSFASASISIAAARSSIECRGAVASFDAFTEALTLYVASQGSHRIKRCMLEMFDAGDHEVRVVTPDVGGGFGPKGSFYPEYVNVERRFDALEASREMDRGSAREFPRHAPGTRSVLGRRDRASMPRREFSACADSSFTKPARTCRGASCCRGLRRPRCPGLTSFRISSSTCSRCSRTRSRRRRCAARAGRKPSSTMERLMDRVARELELDPAEAAPAQFHPARADALQRRHHFPGRAPGDLRQRRLSRMPGVGHRGRCSTTRSPSARRRRARRAAISASASPMRSKRRASGRTRARRCASRPAERSWSTPARRRRGRRTRPRSRRSRPTSSASKSRHIEVVTGDTGAVSLGIGTFAARTAVNAGSSVHVAARAVADKARKLAAGMMECLEDDLELAGGYVRVAQPSRRAQEPARDRGEIDRHARLFHGWRLAAGAGAHGAFHARAVGLLERHARRRSRSRHRNRRGEDPALHGGARLRARDQSAGRRRAGDRRRRARHGQRALRAHGVRRERAAALDELRRVPAAARDRRAAAWISCIWRRLRRSIRSASRAPEKAARYRRLRRSRRRSRTRSRRSACISTKCRSRRSASSSCSASTRSAARRDAGAGRGDPEPFVIPDRTRVRCDPESRGWLSPGSAASRRDDERANHWHKNINGR